MGLREAPEVSLFHHALSWQAGQWGGGSRYADQSQGLKLFYVIRKLKYLELHQNYLFIAANLWVEGPVITKQPCPQELVTCEKREKKTENVQHTPARASTKSALAGCLP